MYMLVGVIFSNMIHHRNDILIVFYLYPCFKKLTCVYMLVHVYVIHGWMREKYAHLYSYSLQVNKKFRKFEGNIGIA